MRELLQQRSKYHTEMLSLDDSDNHQAEIQSASHSIPVRKANNESNLKRRRRTASNQYGDQFIPFKNERTPLGKLIIKNEKQGIQGNSAHVRKLSKGMKGHQSTRLMDSTNQTIAYLKKGNEAGLESVRTLEKLRHNIASSKYLVLGNSSVNPDQAVKDQIEAEE